VEKGECFPRDLALVYPKLLPLLIASISTTSKSNNNSFIPNTTQSPIYNSSHGCRRTTLSWSYGSPFSSEEYDIKQHRARPRFVPPSLYSSLVRTLTCSVSCLGPSSGTTSLVRHYTSGLQGCCCTCTTDGKMSITFLLAYTN